MVSPRPFQPGIASGPRSGRRARSKGRRHPPDPPRTEEIVRVMRCCGDGLHGARTRGLIVILWRAARQGIEPDEIIQTVHARRPPMSPERMELRLPSGR
jgi:hypothetical protein